MKNINIIIILSLIFLSSTCEKENTDDCHYYIEFENNSSTPVYINASGTYPDTLGFGSESPSPALNPQLYKVEPNTVNDRGLSMRTCWEFVISNKDSTPSDTLMVYVFDTEVLENNDWGDVVHYYMVLKRYDLSLQDLENMDWKITYP